ncbi:hypothetical protein BD311DRAFT_433216 [Dichomitus squalens]|uniref:Uncharacterized protein n=1 Tax=Dichomitus squalens TaxID=114155 RepID=A0A4Q9MYZ3_9APHY|nr:hypothetical protein BD311DRAFT_433216 [Dichomitus squalens]
MDSDAHKIGTTVRQDDKRLWRRREEQKRANGWRKTEMRRKGRNKVDRRKGLNEGGAGPRDKVGRQVARDHAGKRHLGGPSLRSEKEALLGLCCGLCLEIEACCWSDEETRLERVERLVRQRQKVEGEEGGLGGRYDR